MKKFKKFVSIILMMALFLVPVTAYAAGNYQTSDFDLVNPGEIAGYLKDSKGTTHTIILNKVAEESSDKFGITITDAADNPTNKDNAASIEFYKVQNNKLEFDGFLDFDTSGNTVNTYTFLSLKEEYKDQPYIYLIYGTLDNPNADYFSDAILFKVMNPFYKKADDIPPAQPKVSPVTDKDTSVKGTTEANASVIVLKDGEEIANGTADAKGNFSISIDPLKAGVKITVIAEDEAGNQSKETILTVLDKTPPAKPVVNPIGDNQTSVSGSAEKDSKVYVLSGSKVLNSAISKGTFTVNIPKQMAGTTLTIYSVDAAGNKGPVVTVKVLDKTPPAIIAVNPVTSNSKTITGKAEKGTTITIYNGKKAIGSGTVGNNGAFSVKIAAQKKGNNLTVTAKDKAGNASNKTIIVK